MLGIVGCAVATIQCRHCRTRDGWDKQWAASPGFKHEQKIAEKVTSKNSANYPFS